MTSDACRAAQEWRASSTRASAAVKQASQLAGCAEFIEVMHLLGKLLPTPQDVA